MYLPDDKDDFKRHTYWLDALYSGSMSDIPTAERTTLAKSFVCYMDALLEKNDEGTWNINNVVVVHEYAARSLLKSDELVFDIVWKWVQEMIGVCKDDLSMQAIFAEGFFDDMASQPSDWTNDAEIRIRDKIFRCMGEASTQWVALEAYDEDVEALWKDFVVYLEHPKSFQYQGPASRLEFERLIQERLESDSKSAHYTLWSGDVPES